MPIFCPLKSSKEFKDLVKELGSEDLAYARWMKDESKKLQEEQVSTNDTSGNKTITPKAATTTKSNRKYAQIRNYLSNRLNRLSTELKSVSPTSERGLQLTEQIGEISKKLQNNQKEGLNKSYASFGKNLIEEVETSLNGLKSGKTKPNITNISRNREVLELFKDFRGLMHKVQDLKRELEPFIEEVMVNEVNKFSTQEKELTAFDIFNQTQDINSLEKGFEALSDTSDYLGRTIGAKIKAAQNRISTENKQLRSEVQKEIDALKEYQKKQGLKGDKIYDVFIQDLNNTTVLTKEYTSDFYQARDKAIEQATSENPETRAEGENWMKENLKYEDGQVIATNPKYINPNFEKIQKTPALKRFYDFHQKITREAKNKLPTEIGEDFIANVKNTVFDDITKGNKNLLSGLKEGLKNIAEVKTFTEGDFSQSEDLKNDVLPLRYIKPLTTEEKSKSLGDNLYQFATFANSYEELSNVLPEVRLLQNQIASKEYRKSSDPSTTKYGHESNIFKMVEDYINAQVKGKKKEDQGKITIDSVTDENGNVVSEKYIAASDIVDFGLRYNSLLKIGLNPVNAVTNYLIGDIGNIIEGFGGRFYNLSNLKDATAIFFKQNFKQDSVLNKLIEENNPLQELDDYEGVEDVSIEGKLSGDKLKNIAYTPQKMGEKFLQVRTMLAIMIKDGYLTKSGELTEKYDKLSEEDKNKLINKIQTVNRTIHGNYSSRDAATLQQNVWYRALIQFRKWIPAAIRSRFGDRKFNNNLGGNVEGRYQTAFRLFFKDLSKTAQKLQKEGIKGFSELEIYNMRKNLAEGVLLLGSIIGYNGLKGDDDDKEWRSKPGVKFALGQLDRVSGDLLQFLSPKGYTDIAKNALPLAKSINDVVTVAEMTPYLLFDYGKEETYRSGPRKGENKFWSRFSSIVPGAKPLSETIRVFNGVDFQEIK